MADPHYQALMRVVDENAGAGGNKKHVSAINMTSSSAAPTQSTITAAVNDRIAREENYISAAVAVDDEPQITLPETDYSPFISFFHASFKPFEENNVFEVGHIQSIRNTVQLCNLLYQRKNEILDFAKTIYRKIKQKQSIPSPAYPTLYTYNDFSDEPELFRKVLEDYIVKLQYQESLSYAPVFETVDYLGFDSSVKILPLSEKDFQQTILAAVNIHLYDGMRMLYEASEWLKENPQYERDFFDNAFFPSYTGCLPKKNVQISNWLESHKRETLYIYANIIKYTYSPTIYNNFADAIGRLVERFRSKCLSDLQEDERYKHKAISRTSSIDDDPRFKELYNLSAFVNWAIEMARDAYIAGKDSNYLISDYAKREKIIENSSFYFG